MDTRSSCSMCWRPDSRNKTSFYSEQTLTWTPSAGDKLVEDWVCLSRSCETCSTNQRQQVKHLMQARCLSGNSCCSIWNIISSKGLFYCTGSTVLQPTGFVFLTVWKDICTTSGRDQLCHCAWGKFKIKYLTKMPLKRKPSTVLLGWKYQLWYLTYLLSSSRSAAVVFHRVGHTWE